MYTIILHHVDRSKIHDNSRMGASATHLLFFFQVRSLVLFKNIRSGVCVLIGIRLTIIIWANLVNI